MTSLLARSYWQLVLRFRQVGIAGPEAIGPQRS